MLHRICLVLLLALMLTACGESSQKSLQFSGITMGTQYHITVVTGQNKLNPQDLQQEIENRLAEINQEMSTYLDDSEISRFNQYSKADWFPVSHEFLSVVESAVKAYKISDGAFEPSIYPLVYLWGFAKKIRVAPPSEVEIQHALQNIGLQHLSIRQSPPALSKDIPALSLDLSAIAKGYGVDALAELLSHKGFQHYLVEIGGEVYAKGKNARGKPWHIAIEQPSSTLLSSAKPIQGLYLSNQAVATSGNYRNYYKYNGKRYAHTLNPKTGKPAKNKLASVTVLAKSTMWADAMATAIMVMGVKNGMEFANQEKLAVFMVIHKGKSYKTMTNQYFSNYQD